MISHALAVLLMLPAEFPPSTGPTPSSQPATTASPLPRRAGPLGVRLDPEAAASVRILEVAPGTPAAAAGVRAGDIITKVGDAAIGTRESLQSVMRGLQGGRKVSLEVERDGARVALEVTLAELAETVDGSTVVYSSVTHPDGYRLRTIITEPSGSPRAKDEIGRAHV